MKKADASRASVHRRLDEVVLRTTNLESDMVGVKNKVDGMEAVTDDVKALRLQAQGAGTLGHWLIQIGIVIVAFAGWLIGLYTWLRASRRLNMHELRIRGNL